MGLYDFSNYTNKPILEMGKTESTNATGSTEKAGDYSFKNPFGERKPVDPVDQDKTRLGGAGADETTGDLTALANSADKFTFPEGNFNSDNMKALDDANNSLAELNKMKDNPKLSKKEKDLAKANAKNLKSKIDKGLKNKHGLSNQNTKMQKLGKNEDGSTKSANAKELGLEKQDAKRLSEEDSKSVLEAHGFDLKDAEFNNGAFKCKDGSYLAVNDKGQVIRTQIGKDDDGNSTVTTSVYESDKGFRTKHGGPAKLVAPENKKPSNKAGEPDKPNGADNAKKTGEKDEATSTGESGKPDKSANSTKLPDDKQKILDSVLKNQNWNKPENGEVFNEGDISSLAQMLKQTAGFSDEEAKSAEEQIKKEFEAHHTEE